MREDDIDRPGIFGAGKRSLVRNIALQNFYESRGLLENGFGDIRPASVSGYLSVYASSISNEEVEHDGGS